MLVYRRECEVVVSKSINHIFNVTQAANSWYKDHRCRGETVSIVPGTNNEISAS